MDLNKDYKELELAIKSGLVPSLNVENITFTEVIIANGINALKSCMEYAPLDDEHFLTRSVIETNYHYL